MQWELCIIKLRLIINRCIDFMRIAFAQICLDFDIFLLIREEDKRGEKINTETLAHMYTM